MIWVPILTSGLRLDSGSWVIIAILVPRHLVGADLAPSSAPSKQTVPSVTRPGCGISRMIARAVSDLPEPDSPTRPTRSPAPIARETSRTTSPVPSLAGKATVRCSTVMTSATKSTAA